MVHTLKPFCQRLPSHTISEFSIPSNYKAFFRCVTTHQVVTNNQISTLEGRFSTPKKFEIDWLSTITFINSWSRCLNFKTFSTKL